MIIHLIIWLNTIRIVTENSIHQILNQFWSTSEVFKKFKNYFKSIWKVFEKFFKCKCKYFSFEKFKCKCKYFSKVFKMHLNANTFDPISVYQHMYLEATEGWTNQWTELSIPISPLLVGIKIIDWKFK